MLDRMASEGIYCNAPKQAHTAIPLFQSELVLSIAVSYAKSCSLNGGPLLMNQAATGNRTESAEPGLMLCRLRGDRLTIVLAIGS